MTPEVIIDIVCNALELDVKKVTTKKSGNGQSKYCDARHIISYMIRFHNGKAYSYRSISFMLGNTIAASSFYNEWMCKEKLIFDKVFKAKFDLVSKKINGS